MAQWQREMQDKKTSRLSGSFQVSDMVDSRQASGRLTPVFRSLVSGSAKEEAYIERMIQKDREMGLY